MHKIETPYRLCHYNMNSDNGTRIPSLIQLYCSGNVISPVMSQIFKFSLNHASLTDSKDAM